MFKISLDEGLLKKFNIVLTWITKNLSPLLILCLSLALYYQTNQLSIERELNTKLQNQAHDDNLQDKIFWRDSYIQLSRILNNRDSIANNEKSNHNSHSSHSKH